MIWYAPSKNFLFLMWCSSPNRLAFCLKMSSEYTGRFAAFSHCCRQSAMVIKLLSANGNKTAMLNCQIEGQLFYFSIVISICRAHFWLQQLIQLLLSKKNAIIHRFWAWTPDVILLVLLSKVILLLLLSKVILLVLLSNFAQCALPCARLNPIARIPWAPSTVQNLKVTLIEWLFNMLLIWWL